MFQVVSHAWHVWMIKSLIRLNSKSYDNITKKKKKVWSTLQNWTLGGRSEKIWDIHQVFRLTGASLLWVVCDRKSVAQYLFKLCDSDTATELAIEATSKPCLVSCPPGWQVKANCETPISDQLDVGAGQTWFHQHRIIGANEWEPRYPQWPRR